MLVAALLILFSLFAGTALPAGRQVFAQVQNPTPLRPFPNQLTEEEAAKELNTQNPDPSLTIYCAQRPTAVQNNPIDKRQPKVTIQVQGNLSADFSSFITPLLSITDNTKEDFSNTDLEKSRQYLADYLEGRAYYEGVGENPNNLSLARLGVFRKLAPQTYQDQLKIAMIKRAVDEGGLLTQSDSAACQDFDSIQSNIDGAIAAAVQKYAQFFPRSSSDIQRLIKMIFTSESADWINGLKDYQCVEHPTSTAAGPFAITTGTYRLVTNNCPNEYNTRDLSACNDGTLSRCDVKDAAELAVRALLFSGSRWTYTPGQCDNRASKIPTDAALYKAVCNYGEGETNLADLGLNYEGTYCHRIYTLLGWPIP